MSLPQLFAIVCVVLALVIGAGFYLFLKWEREDDAMRSSREPERYRYDWHGDDAA